MWLDEETEEVMTKIENDGEPYMGVPFHWKTRVPLECKVKSDEPEGHKFADCQNWQTLFASTREVATTFLAKCSDGIIREVVRFMKLNGMTTGDCPECHQMPCSHTAKLLGWPEKE